MPLTVDIVIYNGFKGLEAIGALSVFAYANFHMQRRGLTGRYDVKLTSPRVGQVVSDTGAPLFAEKALGPLAVPHTVVIVGAWDIESAIDKAPEIVQWVESTAPRLARTVALCSGAFFLAKAGLLDGKRATTHWAVADALKARHPQIHVDADCIFIRDGSFWTSAGVTAGIDLTLALVEEDFGLDVALDVARDLVVYLKRPGGQSQFSSHLLSQATHHPSVRELQNWVLANTDKDLGPVDMAEHLSMSVRNFNRYFKRETGSTPTEFLRLARLEAARRMLEEGNLPAKTIAPRAGFATYEAMRKAFHANLGVTPLEYRERFSSGIVSEDGG
jgi:transcriptional regulator GlxA family with amidase domain